MASPSPPIPWADKPLTQVHDLMYRVQTAFQALFVPLPGNICSGYTWLDQPNPISLCGMERCQSCGSQLCRHTLPKECWNMFFLQGLDFWGIFLQTPLQKPHNIFFWLSFPSVSLCNGSFVCQFDWDMGCPDIWLKYYSACVCGGVSVHLNQQVEKNRLPSPVWVGLI